MSTGKPIYPHGTISEAATRLFATNPFDAYTKEDVTDIIQKEFPFARKYTIHACLTRMVEMYGTLSLSDGYYKHIPKPETIEKAQAEIEDESMFFTSVDIGKHILRYVNSLKMEVLNLNDTLAQRDKQILELQKTINDTRMDGGLTGKEIMEGANS